MKVRELIEHLQTLEQHYEVLVYREGMYWEDPYYDTIEKNDITPSKIRRDWMPGIPSHSDPSVTVVYVIYDKN